MDLKINSILNLQIMILSNYFAQVSNIFVCCNIHEIACLVLNFWEKTVKKRKWDSHEIDVNIILVCAQNPMYFRFMKMILCFPYVQSFVAKNCNIKKQINFLF